MDGLNVKIAVQVNIVLSAPYNLRVKDFYVADHVVILSVKITDVQIA